jgi:hypothetical protein
MTATLTTPPSLEERLATAEEELRDAEHAIGAVVVDGGDEKTARKRVSDARADVENLQLALAEEARRSAAAKEAEREHEEAVNRWVFFSWYAEHTKRIGPVLRLRAELRAAEDHAMALGDLTPAVDPGWIRKEEIADGLEGINLPRTAIINMHVHPANQHCGGQVSHARTDQLSTEDAATWAKRLATLGGQAAKAIGADAKASNLPWNEPGA